MNRRDNEKLQLSIAKALSAGDPKMQKQLQGLDTRKPPLTDAEIKAEIKRKYGYDEYAICLPWIPEQILRERQREIATTESVKRWRKKRRERERREREKESS